MRGLTRTGRQVSEDPDLDNLLSTLSPEEVEELEKDMMKVPDLTPDDGKVIVQGESQPVQPPTSNNVRGAKLDGRRETDPKGRLSQREQSFEVCECLIRHLVCFRFDLKRNECLISTTRSPLKMFVSEQFVIKNPADG